LDKGTMNPFDPDDDPSLEARLAVALLRLHQGLQAAQGTAARAAGLGPLGLQILADLGRGRTPTAAWLATRYGITAPTVSDALRALEARGLVTRRLSPRDARAAILRLTPAGRRRSAGVRDFGRTLTDLVRRVPEDGRGRLLENLSVILRGLEAAGHVGTDRMCVTCRFFRRDRHDGPRPHHCALLDIALAREDLRLECPDHEKENLS
jgi:DNA-binding MarR family transcriptional regulator